MNWKIPGTVLIADRESEGDVERILSALFLGGGISLAQISAVTGVEPYTVQNWVKRGFLAPPVQKRYHCNQLCRVININMLRGVFPLERICGLLSYVNGRLDDESDDTIGDAQLYFLFIKLVSRAQQLTRPEVCERIIEEMLQDYGEPYPGARARVSNVLKVMLTAYLTAKMRASAEGMLCELELEGAKTENEKE